MKFMKCYRMLIKKLNGICNNKEINIPKTDRH